MKKVLVTLMVVGLVVFMTQMASAQASANHTLNLHVNTIFLLTVGAGPITLTVTTGTAGNQSFDAATATSSYKWTHNSASGTTKITGKIGTALPSGAVLNATLTTGGAGRGTSAGAKSLTTSDVDLVTTIPHGYDDAGAIGYSLVVDATVNPALMPATDVVTYTITD